MFRPGNVLPERAIHRGMSGKAQIGAKILAAFLAEFASETRDSWINGYALSFSSAALDDACAFMTED
jgi:hypothetical protein